MADLSGFFSTPGIPYAYRLSLQPASFRGVGFSVLGHEVKRGRRTAVHVYPYSDETWVEDLGRDTRVVSFQGFVISDFIAQYAFNELLTAMETPGPGVLVHPTLGQMTVSVVDFTASESAEANRVVSFRATFIEGGLQGSPVVANASDFDDAGDNFDDASDADFLEEIMD